MIRIADLCNGGDAALRQAAELLLESEALGWTSLEAALNEVRACAAPEHIARMAAEGDTALGWTGAQERSDRLWELHPLVVRKDMRGLGIGTALVEDLEARVRARGGHTMFVGADTDVRVEASFSWTDLYSSLPERLRDLDGERPRQYQFYERCGYVIVGVVPDGKGSGNIYMAKRIAH